MIFKLMRRLAWALFLSLLVLVLPLPVGVPEWAPAAQQAVAALLFVCLAGKLLYDTLFYDHYWP